VSEVGLTTDVPLVDPSVLKFEPEHDVAFELDQVRVELPPRMILVGLAEKFTLGAAGTETRTSAVRVVEPPGPVHVTP
jgi:hypothetical protein